MCRVCWLHPGEPQSEALKGRLGLKLVIPYMGKPQDLDARMARLAEFLGIPYETLALAPLAARREFLECNIPAAGSCLVVNPQVIKEWVGCEGISTDLIDFLLFRFAKFVVHGLRVDAFDSELVAAISRGRLKSVEAIDLASTRYTVASDAKDICEWYAGLSFGPVNPANDHILSRGTSDPSVRSLISIGDQPFMAAVKTGGAEVLFVASEDVMDLNTEVDHNTEGGRHYLRSIFPDSCP
jgi:hypothetical protein